MLCLHALLARGHVCHHRAPALVTPLGAWTLVTVAVVRTLCEYAVSSIYTSPLAVSDTVIPMCCDVCSDRSARRGSARMLCVVYRLLWSVLFCTKSAASVSSLRDLCGVFSVGVTRQGFVWTLRRHNRMQNVRAECRFIKFPAFSSHLPLTAPSAVTPTQPAPLECG